MESLEEKIEKLPPELQDEVIVFIEQLIEKKRSKKKGRKLRQDWAGALAKYRDKYTSIELQKKALEWRED